MITVNVERTVELSADVVWEEMRHFDRVLNWVPGGSDSTIEVVGSGVGAVRDITLATQGYVQHRLVAYDDAKRTFSYQLTAGKPIGMQDYIVVATVTPVASGGCTIRWVGEMTADGSLDEAEVGRALEIALGNMVSGMVALLAGAEPEFASQPNERWQLER